MRAGEAHEMAKTMVLFLKSLARLAIGLDDVGFGLAVVESVSMVAD